MASRFPARIETIECPFAGAPLYLYLIRGDTGRMALIDSGIADTPSRYVLPYLAGRGRSVSDLQAVIVTHAHHDHFGGNGELFRANPNIAFMAPAAELEWVEDGRRHFNEMYRSFPGEWEPDDAYEQTVIAWCGEGVPVARGLNGGESVALDESVSLAVHEIPAHSKGHLMLALEQEGVIFVGDALQGEGTRLSSGITVFPLYDDVANYLHSLELVRRSNAEWICTGHHGVLDRQAAETLLLQSERHALRHGEYVLRQLQGAAGALSLSELVSRLHEAHYPAYESAYQLHATTYAFCRHLQRQGKAKRVAEGGRLLWAAAAN